MEPKRFNAAASVIFFLHGCVFAGNQLLMDNLSRALFATETQKGVLIGAFYCGQMLLCLFFGELSERIGKRLSAAAAAFTCLAGTLIIAFSRDIPLSAAGFFLFGSGLGSFEATMFALSADNNAGRSNRFLNFTQGLFSVGAVLSPLALGAWLPDDSFKLPYMCIAALAAAAAVYFTCRRRVDAFAVRERCERGVQILKLAKNGAMLFYMAAIAIFIGAETALTYWVFDYFASIGAARLGSWALTIYWFSSIAGRFAASRLKSAKKLTAPGFGVAAVGFALLLLLPAAPLKLAAVFVAGVGFAPLYAGISSLAGDLFPARSASAYALMIFSVNLGGLAFQPVISSFAQFSDIRLAFVFAGGLCLVMAAASVFLPRGRALAGRADRPL